MSKIGVSGPLDSSGVPGPLSKFGGSGPLSSNIKWSGQKALVPLKVSNVGNQMEVSKIFKNN